MFGLAATASWMLLFFGFVSHTTRTKKQEMASNMLNNS